MDNQIMKKDELVNEEKPRSLTKSEIKSLKLEMKKSGEKASAEWDVTKLKRQITRTKPPN